MLINRLLSAMTDLVLSLDRTIDKYIGDCVMAFWNAPVDCQNHEKQAVICAARMMVALEKLNKEIEAEGLPEMGLGIGVNSGPCVIGNMGGSKRFDYSAIGDAVNVASRLESSTRKYVHNVLIGEATAKVVPDLVKHVDSIEVKGKSEKLEVYTLSGQAIHEAHLADHLIL